MGPPTCETAVRQEGKIVMEEKRSKKPWQELTMEQAENAVGGGCLDHATPEEKQRMDELWQKVLAAEGDENRRQEHQWAYEAWAAYVDRLYEKYWEYRD